MRCLKPAIPRVPIDGKLRPHPSPARTELSAEGDVTVPAAGTGSGRAARRWAFLASFRPATPLSSLSRLSPPPFSSLFLIAFMFDMLKMQTIYLVTLNSYVCMH